MACDVLPRIDKQICLFERWLIAHLDTITDPARAQLIHRFATWEVLPKLRARAEHKPITPASRKFAGEQITQATVFLDWLAQRQRSLRACDQADIDTWHAEHTQHVRNRLRGFLLWSMASKLTRPLRLPAPAIVGNAPLPHRERMTLLGQLLAGHDLPLRSRVAGIIVLLYAQRVSRIVRLTIDDVITDGDQVLLRLGEPPSPVPTLFAELLLAWISERDNMNTATNPNSRWLFPAAAQDSPCTPKASPGSSASSTSPPAAPVRPPSASTF
jgi:integrase